MDQRNYDPTINWIRGHYHCKKCGGEIKCWKSFAWNVETGVRRIGGCEKDNLIMVEFEKLDPEWIQI